MDSSIEKDIDEARFEQVHVEETTKSMDSSIEKDIEEAHFEHVYVEEEVEVEVLDRPHVCNVPDCGKSYANRTGLRRHVRNTHEKHRFQCDGCGRLFTTNRQRMLHAEKCGQNQVFITFFWKENQCIVYCIQSISFFT